jgi:nucleotide-binding universal stress UspA family protein
MFENILVSIDGWEPSSHALAVAVNVAKQYGARLKIVHAVMLDVSLDALMEVAERHGFLNQIKEDIDEATNVGSIPVSVTAVPLPEELLEKVGKLLLEETASKARAQGVETVETALLGKDAAHEVLHFAETNDINLIVCGTRGLGGIKSFFLGSVSHKLLEEAKCPCLVVK